MLREIFNLNIMMGNMGEQLAKYYSKVMTDALVLHDVLIDGAENMTSQIDLLLIGDRGIYVVEVKNYPDAYIYGDGKKRQWYYYLGNKKYEIYSPLIQNKNHIRYLKKFLKDFGEIPFFSVLLIICKDFKISNINEEIDNPTTLICSSLPAMKRGLKLIAEKNQEVLSNTQKENIYNFISQEQYKDKKDRKIHKEKVIEIKNKQEEEIKNNICPYCKSELVLRKGKFGEFYGCSNYPKCKYTKKI